MKDRKKWGNRGHNKCKNKESRRYAASKGFWKKRLSHFLGNLRLKKGSSCDILIKNCSKYSWRTARHRGQ